MTLLFGLGILGNAFSQGLVVNELSNGTSGTREFFEFVVVGTGANEACGPVDLRGWIIDDNNGDFSCGPCASTGIATGHMRLANVAQWAAVPVGSIIVIYNSLETDPILPAADPDDTVVPDSVYIVPSNHSSLEYSVTGCPNSPFASNSCGFCAGSAAYAGVCYANGNLWTNVNLRNAGDAAQVRRPDGTYFHGFAYGTPANFMSGGADGLINPITGTNLSFFFANTTNDNYRVVGNWSSVAAGSATPGAANTALNAAWIDILRTDCPLPVEYAEELKAVAVEDGNQLTWSTASETNSSHFAVMRSTHPEWNFEEIGTVGAARNSRQFVNYSFLDPTPPQQAFYRLKQVDVDGRTSHSEIVEVFAPRGPRAVEIRFWPHPTGNQLNFEVKGDGLKEVSLLDGMGRKIAHAGVQSGDQTVQGEFSMANLQAGIYFLEVRSENGIVREKIVHLN